MDIIHSSQHFPEIIPIIQTYERGVKFFVTTSRYVTKDLDAGQIIEQDIIRISHQNTLDDLVERT